MGRQTQIVALRGGLGNQLFGLAYGLNLERRVGPVRFSFVNQFHRERELESYLESERVIELGEFSWRLVLGTTRHLPFLGKYVVREGESETPSGGRVKFHWGYWQNRIFADGVADQIRATLGIQETALNAIDSGLDEVVIHVRRGDYVSDPGAAAILGALPADYFIEASKVMRANGHTRFCIVTDDDEWVSHHLLPIIPGSFLPERRQRTPFSDLLRIASAEALVLSNSTFGWWGAFLGGASRPTVAPRNWFNNSAANPELYYPHWQVIADHR